MIRMKLYVKDDAKSSKLLVHPPTKVRVVITTDVPQKATNRDISNPIVRRSLNGSS